MVCAHLHLFPCSLHCKRLLTLTQGVGVSIGVPDQDYAFSGAWSTASKLILCLVMLWGRHRELPVALDRAVRIPGTEEEIEEDAAIEDEDRRRREQLAVVEEEEEEEDLEDEKKKKGFMDDEDEEDEKQEEDFEKRLFGDEKRF